MADIFLTSALGDLAYRAALVKALAPYGWTIWQAGLIRLEKGPTDRKELPAARSVVVLWTRESVERLIVIQHAREAHRRGILVSVKLEDVKVPDLEVEKTAAGARAFKPTGTVPPDFRHVSLVDWTPGAPNSGFDELIAKLNELLGSEDVMSKRTAQARTDPCRIDVFVSYADEDSELARSLARELRGLGHSTWLYDENSIPGFRYTDLVVEAIESCRYFMLIASQKTVHSKVMDEVRLAYDVKKSTIPVRVDLTHEDFMASDPIFRLAYATIVSIAVTDTSATARQIDQRLRFQGR